jgi:hypothetical protein
MAARAASRSHQAGAAKRISRPRRESLLCFSGVCEEQTLSAESGDASALAEASQALREMLFFMEGKPN